MISLLLSASLAMLPHPQQPAPGTAHLQADSVPPAYVPHRVFDTRANRFTDFEAMLADVMYADVLFLGEQHDDASTHRLEAATLEGLARRRSNVVLALEMFERDVQRPLDDYLASRIPEADFLAASRPWPRYRTDYRPMVEFARAWHWPVVAADVPRRFASMVSRTGLAGLDTLASTERTLIARGIDCPHDDYFDRFAKTMGDMTSHTGGGRSQSPEEQRATLDRVYQAQCIKDETMGESVAAVFDTAPPRALVVHVNGAFHSDYKLGTAARAQRRLRGKRVAVVSFVPVQDLDAADGKAMRKLADYVVFTLAPPPQAKAP
ncbi:MAG: ChaN family lipoprotein [Gemmatimonadales bacterium]